MHAYKAEQAKQLSFAKRDVLHVSEQKANGWWQADKLVAATSPNNNNGGGGGGGPSSQGSGWFPGSFVKPALERITVVFENSRAAESLGPALNRGMVCFSTFHTLLR